MDKKFNIKPAVKSLLIGSGIYIVLGLIFITVMMINISTKSIQPYMIVINLILGYLGVYYLMSGIFLFTPSSRFIPCVTIGKNGIFMKYDIFHRSRYFNSDNLKSINLEIHQTTIRSKSGDSRSFRLSEREEFINEQIKSEIINIGKYKDITILLFKQ